MRILVETTLQNFGYYSPDSVNLILGTIAQESAYGKYRKQLGNGPALGICQMEPATFNDICKNYLKYHPDIEAKIKEVARVTVLSALDMISNDRLSVCMCRVHYLRVSAKMPVTIEGYAAYWKQYYNTVKGKGTEAEFIRNYHLYVLNDRG
jgi:hypothetical protein